MWSNVFSNSRINTTAYETINVKKPERLPESERMPIILCVDSRSRNKEQYPASYKYRIELGKEYRQVISMRLIKAIIPKTEYIINTNNNMIHIQETLGSTVGITMPIGNYTITTFTSALQTALNAALNNTYTVSVNVTTNQIRIASDLNTSGSVFKLIFTDGENKYPTNSMGELLGYNSTTYLYGSETVSATAGDTHIYGYGFTGVITAGDVVRIDGDNTVYTVSTVTDNSLTVSPVIAANATSASLILGTHIAPNFYNLTGDSYVELHITDLDRNESTSTAVDGAFVTLPLSSAVGSINYMELNEMMSGGKGHIKYFNPPLGKLGKLDISFLKYDGNYYNFHGREHYLEFELEVLNNIEHF